MRLRVILRSLLLISIVAVFAGAFVVMQLSQPSRFTLAQDDTPLQDDTPADDAADAPTDSAEATGIPWPGTSADTIGPLNYAADVSPLTGLPVDDAATLQRRPIIVKVSNSPALVRPQAGIGQADQVYEHYTEVGVTRFSAVFYSQAPQKVGSIRSARLIDTSLATMYQALLAFAGASIGVDKVIYGSDAVAQFYCQPREDYQQCLAEADLVAPGAGVPPSEFADRAYKGVLYGAPYFYRSDDAVAPHNLFVNLQALWQLAASDGLAQRPDLSGLVFHPQPQPAGRQGAATHLQVRYATTLVDWTLRRSQRPVSAAERWLCPPRRQHRHACDRQQCRRAVRRPSGYRYRREPVSGCHPLEQRDSAVG